MKLILIVGSISLFIGFGIGSLLRWRKVGFGRIALVVSLVGLVSGVLLLSSSGPEVSASIASRSWEVIEGVVADTARTGERAIMPMIRYDYVVDSVSYSDSTDLSAPGFGSKRYRDQTAGRILMEYPPGKVVRVFYNPSDPSQSALRPGLRWAPLMRFAVGGMLIALFGALAFVVRLKN